MPSWKKNLISVLMIVASVFYSTHANADGQDWKVYARLALYGVAAGTLAGAALFPLTKNARIILIGSSLGLYMGGIAGVYHYYHYDDPNNPLSPGFQDWSGGSFPRGLGSAQIEFRPVIAVAIPILSF